MKLEEGKGGEERGRSGNISNISNTEFPFINELKRRKAGREEREGKVR